MSIPIQSKRLPLITANPNATNIGNEPADLLVVFGKDMSSSYIKQFSPILQNLDASSLLLGDGIRNVRSKPLRLAMRDKVAADGQIVIFSHGTDRYEKHSLGLSEFSDGFGHIPTQSLIRWGHEIENTNEEIVTPRKKLPTGKRIVHVIACHVGQVVEEIKPDSSEWKAGYTLIYSDKQTTNMQEVIGSLEAALSYFDWCKAKGEQFNPLKLFLLATKRQNNSITLVGGKLKAPLVSSAPLTLQDLEEDQTRNRITGSPIDLRRLHTAEQALTATEKALLPSVTQQLLEVLFKCLERKDNAYFEKALHAHPELINVRNVDGLNFLIKASDEINIDCVKTLIRLGAELGMFDDEGDTALHVAIKRGNSELVDLLLKAGAWTSLRNGNGQNALQLAEALGKQNIVAIINNHLSKL